MRYFFILFVLMILSCQSNQSKSTDQEKSETAESKQKTKEQTTKKDFIPAPGGYYIKAKVPAKESANQLLNIIDNNKSVGLVAHFKHHKMAQAKGLKLATTHAVFFGNPKLGTPLLQKDQLLGLDLPQKILTFDTRDGFYVYRLSTSYLSDRYDITFSDLNTMTKTLDGLCQAIANNSKRDMNPPQIKQHEGIFVQKSEKNFDQAVKSIQNQIKGAESIKILAELDHQQNAQSVNMELRPTHVIMFGNPQVGIPLMQENRCIAADLPLKMLIYEDKNGEVKIAFNDMEFLFDRYRINLKENYGAKINAILKKIAAAAI